ncbi:unnamed protein product [Rotaria sp. Silwood1]|nr:unnamed protein product [Rotaria sp. Silwood1]
MDKLELLAIDYSIRGRSRLMTVKTEPPSNRRLRYKSDGKRQVEKSRTHPMEINVCIILPSFTVNNLSYMDSVAELERMLTKYKAIILDSTYYDNVYK